MEALRKKIKDKSANVVIIGLGYVGLPVACLLAKNNFSVVGLDKEIKKVNLINKGISPIQGEEPDLENLIKKVVKAKKFFATTNYSVCKSADVVLYEREDILDSTVPVAPRRILWNRFDIEGAHTETFKSHIKIKALTDLWFRASAEAAGTRIDVKLHFYLVDADASGA